MKIELKSSDQIQRETRAAYMAKLRGMSQDEVCEEAMRLYVAVSELENYPEDVDRLRSELADREEELKAWRNPAMSAEHRTFVRLVDTDGACWAFRANTVKIARQNAGSQITTVSTDTVEVFISGDFHDIVSQIEAAEAAGR